MSDLGLIQHPSPNFGPRAAGTSVSILLLHYTGMSTGAAALERLCDPSAEVSSHYLIEEDGRVFQLVDEKDRAWHAGVSSWAGETDINSCSIGIEIVNQGHAAGCPPFPDKQIQSTIHICLDILDRHSISPHRVLAHSDVAPGRKIDPGEAFPWSVLSRAGVGRWTEPEALVSGSILQLGDEGAVVTDLQNKLHKMGYNIEISGCFDQSTKGVVEAFQRHYRPGRVDGVADISTLKTLDRYL